MVTLTNDSKLWKNLFEIFDKYQVELIILGYPLKENGEKSNSTILVEKFKEKLNTKVKIPIRFVDERYSSSIALGKIRESITSKKKRQSKSLIDMNAAAVILQDYLTEIESENQ